MVLGRRFEKTENRLRQYDENYTKLHSNGTKTFLRWGVGSFCSAFSAVFVRAAVSGEVRRRATIDVGDARAI